MGREEEGGEGRRREEEGGDSRLACGQKGQKACACSSTAQTNNFHFSNITSLSFTFLSYLKH